MNSWHEWEKIRREAADAADHAPFKWLRRLALWCVKIAEEAQKEITDEIRRR